MLVKTFSAALIGLEATIVTVEVSLARGVMFHLSGLADTAVKESKSRIVAAMENNGYRFPIADITVNLSPADIKKEGSSYDLPLAIGILASDGKLDQTMLSSTLLTGELGLDGRLLPIKGVLPIAIKTLAEGFNKLIVPKANEREAAVVKNLDVYGMESLEEVIQFLSGNGQYSPVKVNIEEEFYSKQTTFDLDFADVKGQDNVKRALEVAAAGGHNVIMIGPPGSGKSMMAKRLPSILPPLTLSESLETTQIHSIAGKIKAGSNLVNTRPFRSPHHTISQVALIGGGTNPQPGEISLAHNGVLFLDELPEFTRSVLEVMRQPLEDRKITVARAKYTIEYPCSFMFVASMNPCPCGYYGDKTHNCSCSPGQREKYKSKISGPMLDRIDIQIDISPVPFEEISKSPLGESSKSIRSRVVAARERQRDRFRDKEGIYCNAQMSERMITTYAQPDSEGLALLRNAMERLSLSARAYNRILKVSRTIADLEGSKDILPHHLAEAIGYRQLDRNDWAEREA